MVITANYSLTSCSHISNIMEIFFSQMKKAPVMTTPVTKAMFKVITH